MIDDTDAWICYRWLAVYLTINPFNVFLVWLVARSPTRNRACARTIGCPSAEDRGFVASLMRRVTEPGKVTGWIAPPEIGINNTPLDYDYVRLN